MLKQTMSFRKQKSTIKGVFVRWINPRFNKFIGAITDSARRVLPLICYFKGNMRVAASKINADNYASS